jgi:predicted histone-like DNA-binding protein
MIRYILRKIKNDQSPVFNRWFAYPVVEETVNLSNLAKHMASHNTPFSAGVIKGLLTDMINCIKELLLEGKNVKIDDLAIFSLGIKNAEGAESEDEFSVTKNIQGVKLRARATGELTRKALDLVASVKKATALTAKSGSTGGSDNGGTTVEEP